MMPGYSRPAGILSPKGQAPVPRFFGRSRQSRAPKKKQTDRAPEAQAQLAFADVVLVNKVDLVDARSLANAPNAYLATEGPETIDRAVALALRPSISCSRKSSSALVVRM